MMKIFATITDVDMFGFNGRENHPEPSMIGQRVRVHGIETINMEPLANDGEDYTEVVLYATLPNGEPVDLLDFEVRFDRLENGDQVLTPSLLTRLLGK